MDIKKELEVIEKLKHILDDLSPESTERVISYLSSLNWEKRSERDRKLGKTQPLPRIG
jgi:hypothetical protein